MPDPVLPVMPPAAKDTNQSNPAAEVYNLILVQRAIFAQNQILMDTARASLVDTHQMNTTIQAMQVAQTAHFSEVKASCIRQEFLLHACSFSLAFMCGMFTWRLIVLAKNQRSFW